MSRLTSTPWDAAAFGLPTYELADASAEALLEAVCTPGHHTVRVDPLATKQLLHEHGFYYCDTLIEPYCVPEKLKAQTHSDATIGKNILPQELRDLYHDTFVYDRFHRDFNLDPVRADARYGAFLVKSLDEQCVYGLFWRNELAGFISFSGNRFLLHAVAESHRGQGLAKYWWSAACLALFDMGCTEVKSSISASNVAALNLYASLGFGFRNPQDSYHRLGI